MCQSSIDLMVWSGVGLWEEEGGVPSPNGGRNWPGTCPGNWFEVHVGGVGGNEDAIPPSPIPCT